MLVVLHVNETVLIQKQQRINLLPRDLLYFTRQLHILVPSQHDILN
jgi:hypothetical protein